MKRLCVLCIISSLALAATTAAQVVDIPDANLKAAIMEKLGIEHDPTAEDMLRLTSLYAGYRGIADLAGIEFAVNLRDLILEYNQVSDLSPLAGLINLTLLDLLANEVSDLNPLSGLTSLTVLGLQDNEIADLQPLAGLTNLTRLGLDGNEIVDLQPLAGLTNLTNLGLVGTGISDISPLSALTNLEVLGLYLNQISDISPLSRLTNLTKLELQRNEISDLSPLSGLTNLTILYLGSNEISDISALSGLTSLTHLDLRENALNAEAYTIYIPEILANGIELLYDEPLRRTLMITAGEGGSVIAPGEGVFQFVDGQVVSIEAVLAETAYRFDRWTGTATTVDGTGKVADRFARQTTVLVDGDYTLEAVFAERDEGPALGITLGQIDVDEPAEYSNRVVTNNTTEATFVELVTGLDPDPNGMIQMQVVEEEPARAKARFGKYEGQRVLVRFSYLFEDATPGLELVVYLSDVPELIAYDDPLRTVHYVEVGRVSAPPPGRPGSVGSGRFGVFQAWVSTSGLDLSNGTWVELELVQSGRWLSAASLRPDGIRLAASYSPDSASVLVDEWAVEVHCSGYCMDLNGSFSVDEEDFMIVLAYCGAPASLFDGGLGSLYCLDGVFSSDGYVDVVDLSSWDWSLSDLHRTNLCFELPLVAGASPMVSALSTGGTSAARSVSVAATDSLSELLILGKGQLSTVLTDSLYTFDQDTAYLGNYVPASLSNRCNVRLVRDSSGYVYTVNSERGVVRLTGAAGAVVPPGEASYTSEPRYQSPARVLLGLQGDTAAPSGRPILDVAFDPNGYAYVVPVVVQPSDEAAYVAAAKLALREGADPPYEVVQLYDNTPAANDNQDPNHLREIEVDSVGNVYVVNAYRFNEGDILWKYGSDGTLRGRVALTGPNAPASVADPLALHVSADGQTLYLASGQSNPADANAAVICGFSTADLQYQNSVTIQGMHRVTSIAEDPGTGTLYAAGFALHTVPPYPSPYAPPFYGPCLAQIDADADAVEAVPLSNPGLHDLALPTSIVYTGATP